MFKKLVIRDFARAGEVADSSPLTIAYVKSDKLYIQNLVCDPEDRMKLELDQEKKEVVIRLRLNDNEFLGIGDGSGVVEKKTIQERKL